MHQFGAWSAQQLPQQYGLASFGVPLPGAIGVAAGAPGAANATSPMIDVTFENVVVNQPATKRHPWGTGYFCQGVQGGVATGTTSPVPSCFEDRTDAALAPTPFRRAATRAH